MSTNPEDPPKLNFPVAQSQGSSGPPYYESSYNLTPTTVLDPEQVAAAGYEGGFTSPSALKDFVDVVYAQSGGSPGEIGVGGALGNPPQGNDPEYSVGLSQVNVQSSPDLAGGLLLPTTNAMAAHALYKARGWQPWGGVPAAAPGDAAAVAQVEGMTPTEIATVANSADRAAVEGLRYLPPPYPGTSTYPSALLSAKSKLLPSARPTSAIAVLLAGVNPKYHGGVPAGPTIPPAPPTNLPGAATNITLGGLGGLLQEWMYLLNAPPGTYKMSIAVGSIDLSGIVSIFARLVSALPGVIALLLAAATGLLGSGIGKQAAKAVEFIPAGKALGKAVKA